MVDNLEHRVTVLETDLKHVEETEKELKEYCNEIYDVILETKTRLDKQNGILPHIYDQIQLLSSKQEKFEESFDKFIIKFEKTSFKAKILWGGAGTILSSTVFIILKVLGF